MGAVNKIVYNVLFASTQHLKQCCRTNLLNLTMQLYIEYVRYFVYNCLVEGKINIEHYEGVCHSMSHARS